MGRVRAGLRSALEQKRLVIWGKSGGADKCSRILSGPLPRLISGNPNENSQTGYGTIRPRLARNCPVENKLVAPDKINRRSWMIGHPRNQNLATRLSLFLIAKIISIGA